VTAQSSSTPLRFNWKARMEKKGHVNLEPSPMQRRELLVHKTPWVSKDRKKSRPEGQAPITCQSPGGQTECEARNVPPCTAENADLLNRKIKAVPRDGDFPEKEKKRRKEKLRFRPLWSAEMPLKGTRGRRDSRVLDGNGRTLEKNVVTLPRRSRRRGPSKTSGSPPAS